MAKMGWNSKIMLSLFKREASYNAGVTMNSTNACSLTGFTNEHAEWDDKIVNDKDEISGKEFGYDQEIVEKGLKMPIVIPKAKPNDIIGFAALALGNIVTTQDGTNQAFKHKITPIAAGSSLPSIQAEEIRGGVQQYAYKGVKCNTLKIAAKAGEFVSVEAGLVGSGDRSESTTAFVPSISESWLKVNQMLAWLENGTAISISPTLVQAQADISSGTARDIRIRIENFELNYNNNFDLRPGFAGQGILQSLDFKRRTVDLKFTMTFEDKTDLDYYLSQTAYAFEVDLRGALIAQGGTLYYGVQIIVPRFKLKSAPLPKGGPGDILKADFDCEVFEDGTNPPLVIEGYNAVSTYLA